ncbi:MAG: LysM peptidoglycan-binding domain-containing protein, partial [Calditrichaeota bacterium]
MRCTFHILLLFIIQFSCAGSAPLYVAPGSNPAYSAGQRKSQYSREGRDFRSRFKQGKIIVDIYPRRGEGYIDLAVRISNQPKQWQKLKKWNGNLKFPRRGRPIAVPFDYLNITYRLKAIKSLFPRDAYTSKGWKHYVTYAGETMWFIAATFTGDGANYPAIQKANGFKKRQPLSIGNVIIIPLNILSDEFSRALPSHPDLSFEKGKDGKLYAIYQLKKGEALYSAVVVRFTGRVEAADVNEMAKKIMRLNGFRD